MFDLTGDDVEVLQLAISVIAGIVWLAYLNIFWLNFRRQRQSVILINRSIAQDENAHCLVTNMGAEPIYLMEVMAKITTRDRAYNIKVTEREEVDLNTVKNPLTRTNQGPIKSGEFVGIGSFQDLLHRADQRIGTQGLLGQVREMELTVAAADGHASHLVAARRKFKIEVEGEKAFFVPDQIMTHQVRNFFSRRKIAAMLEEQIQ